MTSNGTQLATTPPSSPAEPDSVNCSAATSSQTVVIKGKRYRQRPLGPAPFASFEDLSDELDSPPDTARIPLPGIKEDSSSQAQSPTSPSLHQVTSVSLTEKEEQGLKDALTSSLDAPAPPRIDISRASSSSQHEDSITSSPERENGTHNLGYKEDGTVDLRSSTEELDYIQEPGTVEESEERRKRERMMRRQQQVRDFGDTQSQHEFVERKDSSCSVMSDTGLLCISGRTSRLSSIGSVASGGSAASAASNLSVGSARSSRSPSPHKMLLETSFCGNKPAQCRSAEPEASSSVVTLVEKSASRPPSRLSSRSPSPHKMLLETSFCGPKPLPKAEVKESSETPKPVKKETSKEAPKDIPKKVKPKPTSVTVIEAEITSQTAQKQETPPKAAEVKVKPEKEHARTERALKIEKPKPSTSGREKERRNENAIESIGVAKKIKPFDKPDRIPSKPKKVISIRDLPGDEIFIPLTGPEIDFDEIIRKGSPSVQKKEPVKSADVKEKADEIYIPLHSPPKSTSKSKEEERKPRPSHDSDENAIYIPLHSPPKTSKGIPAKKSVAQKTSESARKKTSEDKVVKGKDVYKKTKYEVCEDGSIIIPLHSPEEERTARKFEEEIKRVDMELQKAREMSERRAREEENKSKQGTADLSDSGSHKSRLSQTFSVGKTEGTSGGSRTPSPGSSLSRKSSFASLFRKSEAHGSPDPSQGGSTTRRKSGTLTTMLKEASDGLRERSRSRSKSRERQGDSSVTPSPLSKKNVFTNLFTKKKAEVKKVSGKENANLSPQFDLRFTFNPEEKSKKADDEGDYIIIPLRDPSDPPVSLDTEEQPITVEKEVVVERPPSPLVILERSESPKTATTSKEVEREVVQEGGGGGGEEKAKKSSSRESMSGIKKKSESEEGIVKRGRRSSSESKKSEKRSSGASLEGNLERGRNEDSLPVTPSQSGAKEMGRSTSSEKTSTLSQELEQKDDRIELQNESSFDFDEKSTPEGVVGVLDDGVRKLKLPPESGDLEEDHERKGLVYQDSFEDELPYVPTTLPLERSVGVKIVPVKHRVAEIKTCPIDRPRSTTPINPTTLEDFVASKEAVSVSEEEKMKISLPREDSITSKSKSPRRFSAKGKTWFEFAEAGLQSPRDCRKGSLRTTPSPPPLPPRSSPPSVLSTSAPPTTTSWVDLESLPEKKKHPKKITTIPILRDSGDDGGSTDRSIPSGSVVYSYVSPENCQCECHDHKPSHSKESESKRGRATQLEVDVELDNEQLDSYVNRRLKSEDKGDSDKSDCKDCELGRRENAERDIEQRPLLEGDSDGENDDSSSTKGDWNLTKPEIRLEADKNPHLSDSSYEQGSQENASGLEHFSIDFTHMKPFGMDLDLDSNRSSLISQDGQTPPE